MEYRLKYRDIPWHVAIFVLPGKVCGTVFIKWPQRFIDNWEHNVIIIGMCLVVPFIVMLILYFASDGEANLFAALLRAIGVIK